MFGLCQKRNKQQYPPREAVAKQADYFQSPLAPGSSSKDIEEPLVGQPVRENATVNQRAGRIWKASVVVLLSLNLCMIFGVFTYYRSLPGCTRPPAGFADTFSSLHEVRGSLWYDYLSKIYTDEQLEFPLSMKSFWVLQTKLLPPALKEQVVNIAGTPAGMYCIFSRLDPHLRGEPTVVFVYQYSRLPSTWSRLPSFVRDYRGTWGTETDYTFDLRHGFPSHTKVEIMRGPDKLGSYTWMYYMKGSGNFYDLGRTIAFPDHTEAFAHFSINYTDGTSLPAILGARSSYYFGLLADAAKSQYDSVQMTTRHENVFKYEIFNLKDKQIGTTPCIKAIQTRGMKDCDCDPKRLYLSCDVGGYRLPAI